MIGAAMGVLQAALPEPTHAAETVQQVLHSMPSPVVDLSSEAPIWENIVRYIQYFFSIMLGTGYVMLKPIGRLLKNPITAVFVIAGIVGTFYFVKITVNAMLGVEDLFDYEPSSAVTPQVSDVLRAASSQ
eukprot:jgi/Ulvmu1/1770/UM118_0009.1